MNGLLKKNNIKVINKQTPKIIIEQIYKFILHEWGDQYPDPRCVYNEIYQAQHNSILPKIVYIEHAHQVLATASLLEEDIDLFPHCTPWLANVYVKPEYRQNGLGNVLCSQILSETKLLGFKSIYLYTKDKKEWYSKKGWRLITEFSYFSESNYLMVYDKLGLDPS